MKRLMTAIVMMTLGFGAQALAQTVEEFDVSSSELLEIDLEIGGSIEIRGWPREAVRVELEGRGRGGEPDIDIRRTEKGVKVELDLPRGQDWEKRHRGNSYTGYLIKVQVPLKFDIAVETMGGGITIADVEGNIEGETMGGQLDLANLKGDLDLTTMGGSIRLVDSEVDGEVTTMGGKVLLENVVGDVDGTSMGGNVVYKNVRRSDGSSTGKAIVISTMGGDIDVASAPFGAKLETMGGTIEVQQAAKFVDAETMGGRVLLHEVDGSVVATSMGGDVEVRVVGDPQSDDRDIELTSMSGEITLTVPRNFSMQVDIELAYTKRRAGRYGIRSELALDISEDSDWDYSHGSARKIIRGRGAFAGGKNKVTIQTVNGDVHLRQGN